jgi:hypothetical protein
MRISTIKIQIVKNRLGTHLLGQVNILRKKKLRISLQKNLVPRMLSHREKGSKFEILAKIEGKEAKFFSKIYQGHIRI